MGSNQRIRANDDGEPNHSAGDPILGQLKSLRLTNVLLVVVRYFGGTKLGVGGLIASYRESARIALEGVSTVEVIEYDALFLTFPYELLNVVERLVNEYQLKVTSRNYQDLCKIEAQLPAKYRNQFSKIASNHYKLEYRFTNENR